MSFQEARWSLQVLAEEEIGGPMEAEAAASRAAEDAAWNSAVKGATP